MKTLKVGDIFQSIEPLYISTTLAATQRDKSLGLVHCVSAKKYSSAKEEDKGHIPTGSYGEIVTSSEIAYGSYYIVAFYDAGKLLGIEDHRVLCLCYASEIKGVPPLTALASLGESRESDNQH